MGAPARTEGTGGSLFSVTGGTAGSIITGDTDCQIRPEAGTWLVRGWYLSRELLVPISYEGGPRLTAKMATFEQCGPIPPAASINIPYS